MTYAPLTREEENARWDVYGFISRRPHFHEYVLRCRREHTPWGEIRSRLVVMTRDDTSEEQGNVANPADGRQPP